MRKEFGAKLDGVDYAVRQGVYAVVFNPAATKVMTVRNGRGHLFLPGGGIENGESHAECLEREFLEETGYKIIAGDYIGNASRYFHSPEAGAWMSDGYFYMAELAHKAQEPAEADHDIEWLDTEQAKEPGAGPAAQFHRDRGAGEISGEDGRAAKKRKRTHSRILLV